MKCKVIFLSTLLLFICNGNYAQGILNRVIKRSLQKAENKVEDMMVEKASEAIAQRIYRSMSDAFDQLLIDASKQDSAYQANYSDSVALKYGELAGTWMARMNETADLPDKYSFDHKVFVEITSNGDLQNSVLYLSVDGSVFGMEQYEKKDKRIYLIDNENDIVVLYMEDVNGKKTAQAIPNMMGLGVAMMQSMPDSTTQNWTFKSTGKTKTVAGYPSKEFESTDGEYESTFYVSDALDISWQSTFSGFSDRFAGTKYGHLKDFPKGFMLESHTREVGRDKEISTWVTQKVEKVTFHLTNADYEFGGLTSNN